MGTLREPKLLKLEVRTPQNMVLYSKSATASLSNICYNCIGNIQVQPPAFPPPAEQPQPIEVSLPDNIASREDIRALSGVIQTLNGTVSLVMKSLAEIQKAFAAMPPSRPSGLCSAMRMTINELP